MESEMKICKTADGTKLLPYGLCVIRGYCREYATYSRIERKDISVSQQTLGFIENWLLKN